MVPDGQMGSKVGLWTVLAFTDHGEQAFIVRLTFKPQLWWWTSWNPESVPVIERIGFHGNKYPQ